MRFKTNVKQLRQERYAMWDDLEIGDFNTCHIMYILIDMGNDLLKMDKWLKYNTKWISNTDELEDIQEILSNMLIDDIEIDLMKYKYLHVDDRFKLYDELEDLTIMYIKVVDKFDQLEREVYEK